MLNIRYISENFLSKKQLFDLVPPYMVYQHFIPDIEIGTMILSPFRKEKVASFGLFFISEELMFKDFGGESGNAIKFTQLMLNVPYEEAKSYIETRVNTSLKPDVIEKVREYTSLKYRENKSATKISVVSRDWRKDDLEYWHPIDPRKFAEVKPIGKYTIITDNKRTDILFKEIAYAYRYGAYRYKIYAPLSKFALKWISNITIDLNWFGDAYLPLTGPILIVTSSTKDAMTIMSIGIPSIAPHSESQVFSKEQYDKYSSRFDNIYILYDNDEPGIRCAEEFKNKWPTVKLMFIPKEGAKDPFEYVKAYSLQQLKDFILKNI